MTFSAGDVIHVIGDMDEDGFFYVSIKLKKKNNFKKASELMFMCRKTDQ